MEDYSIIRDALETWRSTSDWIKAVFVLGILGYAGLISWLVLGHRADLHTTPAVHEALAKERATAKDAHIRELARAELCRLAAEWERARLVQNEAVAKPTSRRLTKP